MGKFFLPTVGIERATDELLKKGNIADVHRDKVARYLEFFMDYSKTV